jgi:colanic acid biosynthesis protein WcaH
MKLDRLKFIEIVKDTPLVSFDLIVRNMQNEVLVGLRINSPAKNYWFVPGGRILKNEHLDGAFKRITQEELGTSFDRQNTEFKGVFQHIYKDNFAEEPGFGTHYIVLSYEIKLSEKLATLPKNQHREYKWLKTDAILKSQKVHKYTKAYFE